MEEREARARGLIDTLEDTLEVDHVLVIPVLARRRDGMKIGELNYTFNPQQPYHKIFHSIDVNMERLLQQAVREGMARIRAEGEAENPL